MRRMFLLVILGAVLTWAGASVAAPTVRGDYMSTGQGTCLNSTGNFNSNNEPIGGTWISTSSQEGIWTFKGDGTGSAHFGAIGLNHPGGTGGPTPGANAATQDITFNFTYNVERDGSITIAVTQDTDMFKDGARKGQPITQTPHHESGMVSDDHRSMTLASPAIEVITTTFLPYPCSDRTSPICVDGMLTTPTLYRICSISRVLIRLDEYRLDE